MMKLGTQTGSLINHLTSRGQQSKPEVGMGATILMWTDRHAATIVRVTPSQVHAQRDNSKRLDTNGMSESQQYEFTPDPEASVEIYRKTKQGYKGPSGTLIIGHRSKYHDYSF